MQPDDPSSVVGISVAARATLVKRGLRTGTVGVIHSLEYRASDKRLVPEAIWAKDREKFAGKMNVAGGCRVFLDRMSSALDAGLTSLIEAVEAETIKIKNGRLVIPRLGADPDVVRAKPFRRQMYSEIGDAQLPDILVEIDILTQYSNTLLRREPRSDKERVSAYAALLALGTDLSASAASRMIKGLDADSIARMMRVISENDCIQLASKQVEEHMRSYSISSYWGDGALASSDMMSLEASRHLWSTRSDPRRRVFAIGSYTHLLDQWGIIYDQPIILNKRQAGAAIEGALRQEAVDLEKLTVDTHGCTHFAMAIAKLCGFDLCPRLAGLSGLKLFLPRKTTVPSAIKDIVSPTVSTKTIEAGWDDLLRIATSIKDGWCSATYALDKFGSAARGAAAYESGVALGKLLRTLFLCDYLSNANFRRDIGRILNRGEALHTLQRALYAGPLRSKEGRSTQELKAISNTLSLLTNIVMAWNSRQIQSCYDAAPDSWPEWAMAHVSPIGHGHINMRGVMTFDMNRRNERYDQTINARSAH